MSNHKILSEGQNIRTVNLFFVCRRRAKNFRGLFHFRPRTPQKIVVTTFGVSQGSYWPKIRVGREGAGVKFLMWEGRDLNFCVELRIWRKILLSPKIKGTHLTYDYTIEIITFPLEQK